MKKINIVDVLKPAEDPSKTITLLKFGHNLTLTYSGEEEQSEDDTEATATAAAAKERDTVTR